MSVNMGDRGGQIFPDAGDPFEVPSTFAFDDDDVEYPSMPLLEPQDDAFVEAYSSPVFGGADSNDGITVIDLAEDSETVQTKLPPKLRRKGTNVNSIFANALSKITKGLPNQSEKIKSGIMMKEPSGNGSANDAMNERLAALREREQKINKLVRKKTPRTIQDDAKEELEALAQLVPAVERQRRRPVAVATFDLSPKRVMTRQKALPVKRESANPTPLPDVSSSEQAIMRSLRQTAKTAEEKYRILDARDKLYQSRREVSSNLKRKLVASCPDMCPEKERMRRCYQMQVSIFEMKDHPRNTEAREEWMVKEYSRSSADQETPLPHDLRPVSVLERTMAHLCRNVADRSENSNECLDDWYMFMWDRTRAIRKDLTHQDLCSPAAARLLEQCARFHIHCAERLIDQDTSVYDDKINSENLTKCLQTLKYMYNDLRTSGIICDNAAEFLAYSLLLNLNNTAIITEIRNMPEDVISSHYIQFALDIITARETKNYVRFFKLVKVTSYLNACILRRYFNEMRVHAIHAMVRSHSRPRMAPIAVSVLPLVDSLMYESLTECLTHLRLCNLTIVDRDEEQYVFLDKKLFLRPDTLLELLASENYVRPKKIEPLSELIWGETLKEEEHVPVQNSFTPEGDFIMSTVSLETLVKYHCEEVREIYDVSDDDNEEVVINEQPQQPISSERLSFQPAEEKEPVPPFTRAPSLFSTTELFKEKPTVSANVPASSISTFQPTVSYDPPATFSFPKTMDVTPFKKTEASIALIPSVASVNMVTVSNSGNTNAALETPSPPQEDSEKNVFEMQEKLRHKIVAEKLKLNQLLERKLEEEAREEERQHREREDRKKKQEMEKKQAHAKKLANEKLRKKKLAELKQKHMARKLREFARRWRSRASNNREKRRLENYKKVLAVKYPLVCSAELLDGNPSGIIIPNVLQVGHRSQEKHIIPRTGMCGPPPTLPLVDIWQVVAPSLTRRARSLYPDPTSKFRAYFPWKLVISLPDRKETGVRLDTFLEMHFVNRFNWKFGKESEPLCSGVRRIDDMELEICIRRVKGPECFEGAKMNPDAVQGANSLLFFLTDDADALDIARQRLENTRKVPEVPVVAFIFGLRLTETTIRSRLHLKTSDHVVICEGDSEQSLVTTLSASLSLAASVASSVPTARSVTLASLLKTNVLYQIWRRCEMATANFDVILSDAENLISHYNNCLEHFLRILEDSHDVFIAPEFEKSLSKIESLEMRPPPNASDAYRRKLRRLFQRLELPPWPNAPIKSTNDLNYRLNQYAKASTSTNKKEVLKMAKWRVYQVIKDTLLWKGLDIFCDEDINTVLEKFPWVAVLREFALIRQEALVASPEAAIIVTYCPEDIQQFCYSVPFIQTRTSCISKPCEVPMPERDSILIAYSRAVEQSVDEKARTETPDLRDQVAEVWEMALPLLFETEEEEPSEPPPVDQKLKRAFEDLDQLKEQLEKRRKILEELIENH